MKTITVAISKQGRGGPIPGEKAFRTQLKRAMTSAGVTQYRSRFFDMDSKITETNVGGDYGYGAFLAEFSGPDADADRLTAEAPKVAEVA